MRIDDLGLDLRAASPEYLEALALLLRKLQGLPIPEPTPEEIEADRRRFLEEARRHRYVCAQRGRFYGPRWKQIDEDAWRAQYGDPWDDAPG